MKPKPINKANDLNKHLTSILRKLDPARKAFNRQPLCSSKREEYYDYRGT